MERICLECDQPVQRRGTSGRWPERCPQHRLEHYRESQARNKRERYAAEPELEKLKNAAASRARRLRIPASRRPERQRVYENAYRRAYGITVEERDRRVAEQGNRCAICGTTEPGGQHNTWHTDHDHTCCPTAKKCCGRCIRGFLCSRCNIGIGLFADDPDLLQAAVTYLRSTSVKAVA